MAGRLPLIACSLDAEAQGSRVREWTELLTQALAHEQTADGVRYTFAAADGLETRIRDLAAAEHACCPFLDFAVSQTAGRIELTIMAPADGEQALRFLFPAPA
jgi:hypothetical protein